jgi:hypothetical protein
VLGQTPAMRADYDVYYDKLLVKGRGSPLWIPGPNRKLPAEYRRSGIRTGDVGIIYRSEGFSFLFNIFLPATHDINKGRVPEAFSPLDFEEVEMDVEEREVYGPNSYLASSSIKETDYDSSYAAVLGSKVRVLILFTAVSFSKLLMGKAPS